MSSNLPKFSSFFSQTTKIISSHIKNFNENLIKDKTGYLLQNLKILQNLNSDGKLIRGFLIAFGYKMLKNDIVKSLSLAVAYELFQTAILIHDDVIDNDNLRRGKETVHFSNYKKYKEFNEKDAKKTGENIAICIGDYGFFKINQILIDNYSKEESFVDLLKYYNDIVLKTVEGELIDVVLSFEGKYMPHDSDLESNIFLIYKLKTAYYTIIGPLCLGLILAGVEPEKLEDIKRFGEKIGIGFQIQDDILGIFSDMGKVIGSDIKEFKQTILYAFTVKKEKFAEELMKYYGQETLTEVEIEETRRIFKESGAYDYAVNMMNKYYDEGIEIIKTVEWIKQEDKEIIFGFVEYLKGRKV